MNPYVLAEGPITHDDFDLTLQFGNGNHIVKLNPDEARSDIGKITHTRDVPVYCNIAVDFHNKSNWPIIVTPLYIDDENREDSEDCVEKIIPSTKNDNISPFPVQKEIDEGPFAWKFTLKKGGSSPLELFIFFRTSEQYCGCCEQTPCACYPYTHRNPKCKCRASYLQGEIIP